MPEKETLRRARADKRAGKSASRQAGEFVREEVHHVREGKHGARSTKQAIAIGLSKARRANGRPYQTAAGHDAPAPRDGIVRCDAATAALAPWTLHTSGVIPRGPGAYEPSDHSCVRSISPSD